MTEHMTEHNMTIHWNIQCDMYYIPEHMTEHNMTTHSNVQSDNLDHPEIITSSAMMTMEGQYLLMYSYCLHCVVLHSTVLYSAVQNSVPLCQISDFIFIFLKPILDFPKNVPIRTP